MSHRYISGRYRRARQPWVNILLIVLAIVIVALLWTYLWSLFKIAIFVAVVYLVYRLLQGHI